MDFRRLVSRISDVLGPDASPERVERIAVALLDEKLGSSPSSTGATRGGRAVVTAYGKDQPGMLHAITGVLSDAGYNVLDVSQKILQDYFTVIMIVDGSGARVSVGEVQKRLAEVEQRRGVRIVMQHEDLFHAMHRV
jgi:ACT domain-containing protein